MTAIAIVPACLDCGAAIDPERRFRRLCLPCEGVRAWGAFLADVPEQQRRLASIVGPEYAALTLADFTPELTAQGLACFRRQRTAEPVLYGVMLLGDVGPGKTGFAAALTRLWVFCGKSVRWYLVRSLNLAIRDTYSGRAEQTEGELVEALTTVDLLVLDDLGREGEASEHVLAVLHQVLDERTRWHRPTLVTTNLHGKGLAERYGAAIADRLRQYDRLVIDGPSRRGAA